MKLTDLITAAPWREAKTYRDTWPHEYVLLQKDGERQLMRAVWQRMHDGEAFNGYFFSRPTIYLFIGDYKYWFMSSLDTIDTMLEDEDHDKEVVLNRARLYHDRRDFYIQYGDTGMREDYPAPPYWMQQNDTDDTKEQQP
ncbi:MAG: hypothetical protein OXI54_09545 [Chloroflexota bacterium]|nr:hypothetical protein [Chloroflexota bacterium]